MPAKSKAFHGSKIESQSCLRAVQGVLDSILLDSRVLEYAFIFAGWRQLFQGGNEIFFRNFVFEADHGLKQQPISWVRFNSSTSTSVFPFSQAKASQPRSDPYVRIGGVGDFLNDPRTKSLALVKEDISIFDLMPNLVIF